MEKPAGDFDLGEGLVEVDDVNAVAGGENELSSSWGSTAWSGDRNEPRLPTTLQLLRLPMYPPLFHLAERRRSVGARHPV
jgi:hypothetical protein